MTAKSELSGRPLPTETSGYKGSTQITEKALQSTVSAVVSDYLGVPSGKVSVNLLDDSGLLGLAITTPATWHHINTAAEGDQTIFEIFDAMRKNIAEKSGYLTDREIGCINFRIMGICKDRADAKAGKRVIK